ncbi:MAG: HPr kinase/phosphorylase [Desulfomonilaceae bacterium]
MIEPKMFQGTLVNVKGTGVLIIGQPGSGKSLAALSLMRSGHKLIADDLMLVTEQDIGRLVGHRIEDNVRIEIRGMGIFQARALFPNATEASSPIDFVVELTHYSPDRDAGRIAPVITETMIMGHNFEKVLAPVVAGMDPGFLIELIVRSRNQWRSFEQT